MSDESQPTADIPAWARQQISDANSEAATKRVELRDTKNELDSVKSQLAAANNESATEKTRADTAVAELTRYKIALAAGVPGERIESIVGRLRGETEAELKADAEQLVKDFGINSAPPAATDHSQGHGGDTPVHSNTPEAAFAQLWADHFH